MKANRIINKVQRYIQSIRRAGRKTGPSGPRSQAGMTMIEMIIVMSLIAGLSVVIIGAVVEGAETARVSNTEIGFGTIKNGLVMYKLHVKRYPTSDQGLDSLLQNPGVKHWRGPYLDAALLEDAWGMGIRYESDGRKYAFTSSGPDQEFDTDDDIHYPKKDDPAAAH